jgi:beta-glucosidase
LALEEKAALVVGRELWSTQPIERLGIPAMWLSDGPTGLRKARSGSEMGIGSSLPATCFPTESALGASWDLDLVRKVAGAIATEAQAAGVQVLLGPGVNLKRSPLCGRSTTRAWGHGPTRVATSNCWSGPRRATSACDIQWMQIEGWRRLHPLDG